MLTFATRDVNRRTALQRFTIKLSECSSFNCYKPHSTVYKLKFKYQTRKEGFLWFVSFSRFYTVHFTLYYFVTVDVS